MEVGGSEGVCRVRCPGFSVEIGGSEGVRGEVSRVCRRHKAFALFRLPLLKRHKAFGPCTLSITLLVFH